MDPGAKHSVSYGQLRRRLTGLVYRDAARAYSAGLALAVFPLAYLFIEWPPWVIRDTLVALPPSQRAAILAGVHVAHGVATIGLVRRLLASERLRWWWALPLPASWWRRLHLGHLVMLDAPLLLAIGYGVAPRVHATGLGSTVADGFGFVAAVLVGQIAVASLAARPVVVRLGALALWGAAVFGAVMVPGVVASVVGAGALAVAVARLGRPLPERRARAWGTAGGHPMLALVRLGWLAVRRHDAVAIGWGTAVQVLAAGLVALAIGHVGATEPEVVRSLQRGLAVICGMVGASLCTRAMRAIDGDRPTLDSWGIDPVHERWSRLSLAAMGATPALLGALVVLASAQGLAGAWLFDLVVATAWAAIGTVGSDFTLQARRTPLAPRFPRRVLRMFGAMVVVVGAGTVLVLVPWAMLEALRLAGQQRRAERARLRFETSTLDDHRT